jgi:hypothetical protein
MTTIQRLNALREIRELMLRDGDVLRIGLPTDEEIEAAPDLAAARMERVTAARRTLAERAVVLVDQIQKVDPHAIDATVMQWARKVYTFSVVGEA